MIESHVIKVSDSFSGYTIPNFELDNETSILLLCFSCSLFASVTSIRLIFKHLKHFSQPIIQRKIIAILWMVPVYAITSWFSLIFSANLSMCLDMVRDCYESFVIYMFFSLCYSYIGQIERDLCDSTRILLVLREKAIVYHVYPLLPINLVSDASDFLLRCKRNILQFLFVKPASTVLAIILVHYFDLYEINNYSISNGYIYITLVVNISISISLYWLVMFYQATRKALLPFDPIPKFICVKSILFFSYWQSLLVDSHVQNVLICIEMSFFAIAHSYAFPTTPFLFLSPGPTARSMIRNSMTDIINDINQVRRNSLT